MDFRERKVGRNGTAGNRYDGVFAPIARHIRVNHGIIRDNKIDILILEFAIPYANRLADTFSSVFP